ncbi:MAG: triose-phosphate isomerase [Gammaproteobacteria bacterium]|nr:triose-phosphate isomerase [Gammaproteobacteria bacterium]
MTRPLIAANWKMNGDLALAEAVIAGLAEGGGGGVDVLLCPPFVYLREVARMVRQAKVAGLAVGAQNLDYHAHGAFTGEVSAAMIADAGCEYVIVGHSERRALFGESDDDVARKAQAARGAGLAAVVCVGETFAEREAGRTEAVVESQLAPLAGFFADSDGGDFAAAYEPVWAIGSGQSATPGDARAVHEFIRRRIADHNPAAASRARVIYGGSVKPGNAAGLFAEPGIDGALVGGASLAARDFLSIIRSGYAD